MTSCTACGTCIGDKKDRCSLTEDALATLSAAAAANARCVKTQHRENQYMCKKCKSRLQRLQRLKKQVLELEESIVKCLPASECEPQTASSEPSEPLTLSPEVSPNAPIVPTTPQKSQDGVASVTPKSRKRPLLSISSSARKRQRLILGGLRSRVTTQSMNTSPVAVSIICIAISCVMI